MHIDVIPLIEQCGHLGFGQLSADRPDAASRCRFPHWKYDRSGVGFRAFMNVRRRSGNAGGRRRRRELLADRVNVNDGFARGRTVGRWHFLGA